MERCRDLAIVASTVDYAEADRLVTLLTQNHGKLTAFAKGARKSRRRFAGALEPMTLLRGAWVERRGSTVRLDEVEIQDGFVQIRSDLSQIAQGLYCVDLCRELVRDRQPHPELFELLKDHLHSLDRGEVQAAGLIAFELKALAHAGFMPRFINCSLCGGGAGPSPRFDPAHGGVVCGGCRGRAPWGIAVASSTIEALHGLQRGRQISCEGETQAHARQLLDAFISHQIGKRLRAAEFLRQVGLG